MNVLDVLQVREGDLLELTLGEAMIRGRYESYRWCGMIAGPMLVADRRIGHGYNIVAMVKQGWSLRVISDPKPSVSRPEG